MFMPLHGFNCLRQGERGALGDGSSEETILGTRRSRDGLQPIDDGSATPQVVPTRLSYMTPEWKDAFRYAITLGSLAHPPSNTGAFQNMGMSRFANVCGGV